MKDMTQEQFWKAYMGEIPNYDPIKEEVIEQTEEGCLKYVVLRREEDFSLWRCDFKVENDGDLNELRDGEVEVYKAAKKIVVKDGAMKTEYLRA